MQLHFFVILLLVLATAAGSAQTPAPPGAAAERKFLDEALSHIHDKKYVFAVARLVPLAKSRTLPAPVVKAIPGLIGDLRSLEAVRQLAAPAANGKSPAVAFELLPANVKRPHAWLELLQAVEALIETPLPPGAMLPWSVEKANTLLNSVTTEFGAETASRLRVELSARLFLIGRPADASKLIEDETPNEYAREILADLRTIVLGGGILANPQVARFVPEKGLNEMPGITALIPPTLRDKWQRPKPPADTETTLAKLQKRAAAEIVAAAKPEAEKLARKVDATVAAIRAELAKP